MIHPLCNSLHTKSERVRQPKIIDECSIKGWHESRSSSHYSVLNRTPSGHIRIGVLGENTSNAIK
jgi:hypothetical protein